MAESRVQKTLLNSRVNLIFYFLTLLVSFFSRKIFLDCLGVDFIGFTGTLGNLLGFLNLAELGVGSAIGYLLYKPLFDNNRDEINDIISVMGYLYRWIGLIILGAGIILSCFLPLIFPKTDTHLTYGVIYFAYYAFLGSSLIGYFINYRQNLLSANQKNYVVTAYYQTINIIKVLIQMTLAYYTKNLYVWISIEFGFGIIYSFILNKKINETYPWLHAKISLGKKLLKKYPQVIKKTKQVFVHRIGAFVQYQTTPFLTYALVSLDMVAYYGNYTLIIYKLQDLISSMLGGMSASVGNLCAEGNVNKSLKIYRELFSLYFYLSGSIALVLLFVLSPFIALWLGEIYILSGTTTFLIALIFFIRIHRGTTDSFINGYGLFQDTWSPLTETAIFIIIAIGCGYFWGLDGILLGSVVSLLSIIEIWKPYFLFKKGFKISVLNYWKYYILDLISLVIVYFILFFITKILPFSAYSGWFNWLAYSSIILSTTLILNYFLLKLVEPGMTSLSYRLLYILKIKK